jgi:PAS domain S-box-containing protein
LLLVLLVGWGWATDAYAQSPDALAGKNVLILHAFEPNIPIFELTDRGLRASLDAGGVRIRNQFFEYLDLARNPDPEHREKLAELMRLRYARRAIDAIVTMYPEALHFLLQEGQRIFRGVPAIALYLAEGFEMPKTDRRVIGHTVTADIVGTLEIALKLVPDAKNLYIVSGAHKVDRGVEEKARRDLKKWGGRLEIRSLSDRPFEEMLTAISSAPAEAIVLLLGVAADVTGKTFTTREVASRLGEVSRAPVFGLYDVALGYGIVGGSLISFEGIGTRAGQLALDILSGTKTPGNISATLDVPPAPKFDWQQLKRWSLSVDAVPPGSIIINREYTLWERSRTAVIVAFFVLVLQALLIVSLAVSRAQRRLAERQLAEQLQIASLVADLSARFVHLPAGQIESEIQEAQRQICETLDLDRSTLLQVPPDEPGTMCMTHVHTPSETPPVRIPMDMRDVIPWSIQRLLRGEALIISALAALPPEAARDRETFQRYGTKAVVAVPLVADGVVVGALSFAAIRAERSWPDEVVRGFRIVAEVIANALARQRADQALRESQTRLTLAVASAEARLWEVEAETERVWMTEEGRAYFGLGPNEAMTFDRLAEFIHPDDRVMWRDNIRQALDTGRILRNEFRVLSPDGSVRWIASQGRPHGDVAGRPRRLLGVSIDVTERRQVEEQLRASEALSTGVFASLPGHMVIVDRSGTILRTSDTWQTFAAGEGALDPTVLAVGARQHPASSHGDAENGPIARKVLEGVETVLDGTQAEFRLEYAYPTRTEERWASVSALPLQRPEGGVVIYHQDITMPQRSRLEAERLRRDLTHVARVSAMGEMTAALAHELNQPLTAILSNAHAGERYMAQAAPPLDEIREILQDVVGDARRAGEVIQRLRGLLRKEGARFLPLDVNQVIREIAALVHTDTILRNVVINLDLEPELPPIRGDGVQLQQVLLNLVLNGMEAMSLNGEGRQIVLQTRQGDGAVRISVRDQGPGIPADTLPRVFETFYTTKPSGMGVGLAISRSIVEAHGGKIWAENNPDRGATVSFTLPACPPDPSPA